MGIRLQIFLGAAAFLLAFATAAAGWAWYVGERIHQSEIRILAEISGLREDVVENKVAIAVMGERLTSVEMRLTNVEGLLRDGRGQTTGAALLPSAGAAALLPSSAGAALLPSAGAAALLPSSAGAAFLPSAGGECWATVAAELGGR